MNTKISNKSNTSEDALRVFEIFINANLPKFYRESLLKKMREIPLGDFNAKNERNNSRIEFYFHLNAEDPYKDLARHHMNYGHIYPVGFLEIAKDPFGNIILLCLKGSDRGKVYFWNHEEDEIETWNKESSLLSDSFELLVEQLKRENLRE